MSGGLGPAAGAGGIGPLQPFLLFRGGPRAREAVERPSGIELLDRMNARRLLVITCGPKNGTVFPTPYTIVGQTLARLGTGAAAVDRERA